MSREKIITRLGEISAFIRSSYDAMPGTQACELYREWAVAVEQAAGMLKAQEAVKPGLGKIHHDDGSTSYFLQCPFDGTTLVEGDNYCRKCGRAVKWE